MSQDCDPGKACDGMERKWQRTTPLLKVRSSLINILGKIIQAQEGQHGVFSFLQGRKKKHKIRRETIGEEEGVGGKRRAVALNLWVTASLGLE